MTFKDKYKWVGYGIVFFIIYTVLDYLNTPYTQMYTMYGLGLVSINILLNFVLAYISSMMLIRSERLWSAYKYRSKAESMSYVALVFGLFTYSCTPCVIGILSGIGITYSVIALPLLGLPYKVISLLILVIGYAWIQREQKRDACKL